jgi:cytochrome P450
VEASEFDLTDPEAFAAGNPHAAFRRLRAEDPVHWTMGRLREGFWSVTRYEDVRAVFGNSRDFSSQQRGVLVPASPEMELLSPADQGCGVQMVESDNPIHLAQRKALNRLFLPRAVARLEARARQIVIETIEAIAPRGECDFVAEVAARLPTVVICEMLELPRADWEEIFRWANMAVGAEDPEYQIDNSAVKSHQYGMKRLRDYALRLTLERRQRPGADLLSLMGDAEIFGRKLTGPEIEFNGFGFVIGGFETTRNAISGGMLQLIRNPDQWRRLIAEPALIPTAVEEILRWTSPVTSLARSAVRDRELRGRKIRAGQRVVVWIASANRDEEAFPDPDRFDVGRSPNNHVAFGYGEHFCLGAHLARLEMRIALEELMRRMPDMRLAGEVERLSSNVFAGIKQMPVRFTPRSRAA